MVTGNPIAYEDALDVKRTPEQREALARLLKLAEEQGVKPLSSEDLDAMRGVWPEEETKWLFDRPVGRLGRRNPLLHGIPLVTHNRSHFLGI